MRLSTLTLLTAVACTPVTNHSTDLAAPQPADTRDAIATVPDAPEPGEPPPHSDPLPTASARSAVDRLSCSFHWRRSDTVGFRPRDEKVVLLRDAGDGRDFDLGDVRIAVALEDTRAGGHSLLVSVIAGSVGVDDTYDFGAAAFPANLPPAGGGFTGLTYVTHPDTGSELQYYCESGAKPQPGPAAPAGTRITCEVAHVADDADGQQTTFVVDPTHPRAFRATLDAMTIRAHYLPGGAEASAFIIDVGPGGGNVRGFYQGHDQIPSNLFAGLQGFTGLRTIADRKSGETLTHSCWVAK